MVSTNTAPFTKSKGLSFLFLSLKSLNFKAFSTSFILIEELFFLNSSNLLKAFFLIEHRKNSFKSAFGIILEAISLPSMITNLFFFMKSIW